MKKARILRVNTRGEDVAALQKSLTQIGLNIAKDELKEQRFGKTTRNAVQTFQQKHKIKSTGQVDQRTVRAFDKAVQALGKSVDIRQFVIRGRVIELETQRGIDGLRVEVWDKDARFDNLVASAVTEVNGDFLLEFEDTRFREVYPEATPDLYFKVFRARELLHSTEDNILWNVFAGETQVTIEVEAHGEKTSPTVSSFQVRGRILQPDGQPVVGFTVKAFDKDVRSEQLLGKTATDTNGSYTITYTLSQLSRSGKAKADLVVRAYDPVGEESATSPVILGAPADQVVELVSGNQAYRGPSEYARLKAKLDPLLGKVDASGLNEQEVAFLAGKTGFDPLHIAYYVKSALLEKQSAINAEAFYGLLRQDLPASLPGLIVQDSDVQRKALEAAVQDNLIGASYQSQVDQVLSQLAERSVEQAFQKPRLDGMNSLSELLATAKVSEGIQRTFLKAYQQHQGPIEDFWAKLRADPSFGDTKIDALQFTLQLGVLTQNHLPLVKSLQATGITSLQDLANHSLSDLDALLRKQVVKSSVGVPPNIAGEDSKEKVDTYVRTMLRMVEDAFPTQVIAASIQSQDFPQADTVADFLVNNPSFDFRTTRVDTYLSENADTLSGVEDKEVLTAKLKSVRCLFNVAPRFEKYDAMKPLLADGVISALAIQNMGEASFLRKYSKTLGAFQAAQMFANAGQAAALAVTLFAENSPVFNHPGLYVMDDWATSTGGSADYETLFGSLDLCECEHCRSVYSPAAYLVDLMHMLSERKATGGKNALQILYERRSDIGKIELTCKNTNTLMPYVDLVNEVLENAVAGTNTIYQTSGKDTDLRIYPENLNVATYDKLEQAYFPWTLPFNLWTEETRAYLAYMGAPRYAILEDFSTDPSSAQTQLEIATEYLGLTTEQRKIITGESAHNAWDLWGVKESVWNTWINTGTVSVSSFLKQSCLDFKDLQELCDVEFVHPAGAVNKLQIKFLDANCDTTKAYLEKISTAVMGRIQRFVRLQQALGWTIRELDAALRAIPPNDIKNDFLVNLSYVRRAQEKLGISLKPLLSFWANINTTRYAESSGYGLEYSLYETLFLSKTIASSQKSSGPAGSPTDPHVAFALNASASELNITNNKMSDEYVSTIQAALGVNAKDLSLLATAEFSNELKNVDLNIKNLTTLFRAAVLAKALKLSMRDFLALRDLCGINPFDPAKLLASWEFLKVADLVSDSGFSISELDYLLRHRFLPNSAVYPSDKEVGLFLADLRSNLQKIDREHRFSTDPDGTQTAKALAKILEDENAKKALSILNGTSTESIAYQENFIDKYFVTFITDLGGAKTNLIGAGALSKEQRFDYVLKPLLAYLCQSLGETLVKQKVADTLSLQMEAVDLLLEDLVASLVSPTKSALDDFLDLTPPATQTEDASAGTALSKDMYPTHFDQFRFLDKLATIINTFKLPAERLTWLFEKGADFGLLDLESLPMNEVAATNLFAGWSQTVRLVALDNGWASGDPAIYELLPMPDDGSTSESDFCTAICDRAGWLENDLEFLMVSGFNLNYPNDYHQEKSLQQLLRFKRCFKIIKRAGMSAEQVWGLNQADVEEEQARQVRQAVKANYEESQWLKVAEPLRDTLREEQRSALVDYLVNNLSGKGINNDEDLFGHFLIDIKMSPCMQTSRIKQAISSVQLFIQRCFMNLEKGIYLTPADAREWEWMKNYRVWEANRKVFLYPENWIEPELRDDKSPFFEELENELLQCDVNKDTADPIFLNYLEKLDQVAQLEICGTYEQKDLDILHVFGRTLGIPHIYYYRRWVEKSYWTPWELVDLDIEGDHLVPVVYNRRLYLFWPVFTEVAEASTSSTGQDEKPKKHYEIQFAWSEYKNGKWLPKRQTNESVATWNQDYGGVDLSSRTTFRFWTYESGGNLLITLDWLDENDKVTKAFDLSQFVYSGNGKITTAFDKCASLDLLSGQKREYMWLKGSSHLELYSSGKVVTCQHGSHKREKLDLNSAKITEILGATPSSYRILLPHQYRPFISQAPFFYEDRDRAFFVFPYEPGMYLKADFTDWLPGVKWYTRDKLDLKGLDLVPKEYALSSSAIGSAVAGASTSALDAGAVLSATASDSGNVVASNLAMVAGQEGKEFLATTGAIAGQISHGGMVGQTGSDGNTTTFDPIAIDAVITAAVDDTLGIVFIASILWGKRFRFETFFHPYVSLFIKQLNRYGIDGLLKPKSDGEAPKLIRQLIEENYFDDAKSGYQPTPVVDTPYPLDEVDFEYAGAYSLYNWELFFHAPFLIANHLSSNQRFDEAQEWYHYIFDPTDVSSNPVPARFWKLKPFFKNSKIKSIQKLMLLLKASNLTGEELKERESLEKQIKQWRKEPFKPHLIARLRLSAYQKAIVMKYLDNLVAWGDNLFRRDTIESVNEATQLYILAAQILGRKPEEIPSHKDDVKKIYGKEVKTFDDLLPYLDAFSNALVDIEAALPPTFLTGSVQNGAAATSLVFGPSLFFCIPKNEQLFEYWNTVADRLFKIRHCMNIEGVVRSLALFEPPIDPALLVRAAAAGVDLSSVLLDMYAPLPYYRFQVLLQKAAEICADVKALGTALLSALEKYDFEALALLRSGHEIKLLKAVKEVKKQQVDESEENLDALKKSREMVGKRIAYYERLITEHRTSEEDLNLEKLKDAQERQGKSQEYEISASVMHIAWPDISIPLGPGFPSTSFGGSHIGSALQATGQYHAKKSGADSYEANKASIEGGYKRREKEWEFQADSAKTEEKQIAEQITAAEIRVAIAEQELKNHDQQMENTKEVDKYMRDKFTNKQLYYWMTSRISTLYFQSYQLAYDLAKRAEKAFQQELGVSNTNFIKFGYWDSLKKGLLAGERLGYDMKRMEVAYLEKNKREYEITKHISLAMLDPEALVKLREKGECYINLPEEIFDLDFPGHYLRRIKTVGLSIPCVTGPYTNVNCTLTLESNRIRTSTSTSSQYKEDTYPDSRFTYNIGGTQSVVTSRSQEDSGLFELNLRDERYLPFEGAGVISTWQLTLPFTFRQFDYDTIADVVIHLRYTARDGGATFKATISGELEGNLNAMLLDKSKTSGLFRMFSLKQEFPDQLHKFLNPSGQTGKLTLSLTQSLFPYMFHDKKITINTFYIFARRKESATPGNSIPVKLTLPGEISPSSVKLTSGSILGGLPVFTKTGSYNVESSSTLILEEDTGFVAKEIEDIGILCNYTVSKKP